MKSIGVFILVLLVITIIAGCTLISEPHNVVIEVVDQNNISISNATVSFKDPLSNNFVIQHNTDENGNTLFSMTNATYYEVDVSHSQYPTMRYVFTPTSDYYQLQLIPPPTPIPTPIPTPTRVWGLLPANQDQLQHDTSALSDWIIHNVP
jgi:hypothetical protein